jgi:hypothetical protein
MPTYINQDGLEVRFGADIGNRGAKAGVTTGSGKRRELVLTVDLVALGAGGTSFTADLNNDGTKDGFNPSNTPLPVGAIIDGPARIIQLVTPAGGTSYSVGTWQENGTVVDADGINVDAGLTAGAQVGTQVSSVTGPWYVGVKATGTYTAGKVKIVVPYVTV